jgi:hypothetical protein
MVRPWITTQADLDGEAFGRAEPSERSREGVQFWEASDHLALERAWVSDRFRSAETLSKPRHRCEIGAVATAFARSDFGREFQVNHRTGGEKFKVARPPVVVTMSPLTKRPKGARITYATGRLYSD